MLAGLNTAAQAAIPNETNMTSSVNPNSKCLEDHPAYLKEGMQRIVVPTDKVSWSVPFPEYDQAVQAPYNHKAVIDNFAQYHGAPPKGWAADPAAVAYAKDVVSYTGTLPVDANGAALNPGGRTGIKEGRGLLGNPGPNFAADPIILRINPETSALEMLLVKRSDTGAMAIPGGMVDFGELAKEALVRELQEETGIVLNMDDATVVYKGYVDDPRNTDHAWMETTVAVKLLSPEDAARKPRSSDEGAASWEVLTPELVNSLYASHSEFVKQALRTLSVEKAAEVAPAAATIAAILESSGS